MHIACKESKSSTSESPSPKYAMTLPKVEEWKKNHADWVQNIVDQRDMRTSWQINVSACFDRKMSIYEKAWYQ